MIVIRSASFIFWVIPSYNFVAVFSLNPSTFKKSAMVMFKILGIVLKLVCWIIRDMLPELSPSTWIPLKNPVMFFSLTSSLLWMSRSIISTWFGDHLYGVVSGGIRGVVAGVITLRICGITSPLRTSSINAPTPIRLSCINLPLNPVAYSIFTPPRWIGSICTRGFKYPSLLGVHITFITFASTICSDSTILKANEYSGLPSDCLVWVFESSVTIMPSISYGYVSRHLTRTCDKRVLDRLFLSMIVC